MLMWAMALGWRAVVLAAWLPAAPVGCVRKVSRQQQQQPWAHETG
jgi:hypothetical protein